MNRRNILAALPLTLAIPMMAQAASGNADEAHIQDTTRVGSLSLLASRLAVQRATHAEVKQFAHFEVAEQETVADVLASIKKQIDKPSGKVNPPTKEEAMAHLDAKGKAELEKLTKVAAGAPFDREYIKAQLEGHGKLLKIQDAFLARGGARDQIGAAKLARGMIKEHIALLERLSKIVV